MTRHRFNVLGVCFFAAALVVLLFIDTHHSAGGPGPIPVLETLAAGSYGLFGPDCPEAVPVCVKNPQIQVEVVNANESPVPVVVKDQVDVFVKNKVDVFVNNTNVNPIPIFGQVHVNNFVDLQLLKFDGAVNNFDELEDLTLTVVLVPQGGMSPTVRILVPLARPFNVEVAPNGTVATSVGCNQLYITSLTIHNGTGGPVADDDWSLVTVGGPGIEVLGPFRTVGNNVTVISYPFGVLVAPSGANEVAVSNADVATATAVVNIAVDCRMMGS